MNDLKNMFFKLLDEYFEEKSIQEIDLQDKFYQIKNKIYQKIKIKDKVIGVFVAFSKNKIGFSICCNKDKFNKEYALKLAVYRAIKQENPWLKIPKSYKKDLAKFIERINRYYKWKVY